VAFSLPLPVALRKARWKVKIRDKETRHPPHVTIMRGTKAWRINLRTGEFMDANPAPSRVPGGIVELIKQQATWQRLCDVWDEMYPGNPVSGDDENEE
jgi:hypothetical protein